MDASTTEQIGPRSATSFGRIVARNVLSVVAGEWTLRAINFAFVVYVVRFLGESGYGQYTTVVAFVGLFELLFELGMSQYVQREIARGSDDAATLFWNMVLLRLLLAAAGVAAITLAAAAAGYDGRIVFGVLLHTSTFVLAAVLVPLTTVLTANERFDLDTLYGVVVQLLGIALALLLLQQGWGFLALLWTGLATMPVHIALCIRAIRRFRYGPLAFSFAPRTWPRFLRNSLPFGLGSLAMTTSFNADTVLLSLFWSAGVVGWYNAAYRLVFTLLSVVSGFWHALTPSLAREQADSPQRVGAVARAGVLGLALYALPAAVGVSVLAAPIVELLFGPAFLPAAPLLAIVIWDVPLLMFAALCGNISTALGLERRTAPIYVAGAVLNVVGNLVLIPSWGAHGAAVVTLATDGLVAACFVWLLGSRLELRRTTAALLRTALAAFVMGLLVWQLRSLPLPAAIGAGVVSFGVLAVLLRLVPPAAVRRLVGWMHRA